MPGSKEFRELLIADVALVRGVAKARDVTAAILRYWEERGRSDASVVDELLHIARLPREALRPIEVEVDRLVVAAGGDPLLALTRHGGLDRSMNPSFGPGADGATSVPLHTLDPQRYVNFALAGRGGMGAVYMALDTEMNRLVAFKVVRTDVADPDSKDSPTSPLAVSSPKQRGTPASEAFETLKARFLQEAWITGGMEHPGIVPVYEMGQTPGGVPYYTMRFVRGQRTLAQAIEETGGRLIEARLALLDPFLKLCDAVRYAHSKGVVHRDLKPANVALGEFGEVVLLDWGLAKLEGREDVAASRWQEQVKRYRQAGDLTTIAGVLGTPGYMAPEAARGDVDAVDARSDIYSLGSILFEILTGRLPFECSTYSQYLAQVTGSKAPAALEVDPTVPPALSDLCGRALSQSPALRPQYASDLASAIRRWQAEASAESEIQDLLREARATLRACAAAAGEERVRALDRVAGVCEEVLRRQPGHEKASALLDEARQGRRAAVLETESLARRRILRRAGVAMLAVMTAGALVAALVVNEGKQTAERATRTAEAALQAKDEAVERADRKAQEAIDAARRAQEARTAADTERARANAAADAAALAQRLAESNATEAHAARDEARAAATRARVFGLVQASLAAELTDPMLGLLLARRALQSAADGAAVGQLHAALMESLERAHLSDHEGWIECAAFSHSGGLIATGGRDHTARLWDLTGRPLCVFRGHTDQINTISFAPDDRSVLTASKDGTARRWGLDGQELSSMRGYRAEFLGTEGMVVTVTADRSVHVHDAKGAHVAAGMGHEGAIWCLTAAHDGRHFATAGADRTARVWDVAAVQTAVLRGHEDAVASVEFSPDSKSLLTASRDATARIWDLEGQSKLVLSDEAARAREKALGRNVQIFDAESGVWQASFSPDGQRVLTVAQGMGRLYTVRGEWIHTFDRLMRATFVPDSHLIVAVDSGNARDMWLLTHTGDVVQRYVLNIGDITPVVVSPTGHHLLSVTYYGGQVWDVVGSAGPRPSPRGLPHPGDATILAFKPDATGVVVETDTGTCDIVEWDGTRRARLSGHTKGVLRARYDPSGTLLGTCAEDGSAFLWQSSGERAAVLAGHEGPVGDVRFSPDGRHVLTASGRVIALRGNDAFWDGGDGTIRIWTLTGSQVGRVQTEEAAPGAAFLADSARILVVAGSTVATYGLDGARLSTIERFEGPRARARLSPSGDRLLTYPDNQASKALLRDERGEVIAVLDGHMSGVTAAAFSPDGSLLATTSGSVGFLWTRDGTQVARLEGHESWVHSIAFSPRDGMLATGSQDGTVRLWSRSGREIYRIRPEPGERNPTVSFSPDGRFLHTVDRRSMLWYMDTAELLAFAERRSLRPFSAQELRQYAGLLEEDRSR